MGYQVQVAEAVSEVRLAPGAPTQNFITGIVTHPAYGSDDPGAVKMEAEGRERMGAAPTVPHRAGRFAVEDFPINVEEHQALGPAGKGNTPCSRLEEAATGKVTYRF